MTNKRIFVDIIPIRLKLNRLLWLVVRALLFRPFAGPMLKRWRSNLLRLFGAKIGEGCNISSDCNIWLPSNLIVGNYVCIAPGVDCYNVDKITIANYATVSQRAFLCTASHDISKIERPLITKPIKISEHAWVCSESFIAFGVCIGNGTVIGARSVLHSSTGDWEVWGGNPAAYRKKRLINN